MGKERSPFRVRRAYRRFRRLFEYPFVGTPATTLLCPDPEAAKLMYEKSRENLTRLARTGQRNRIPSMLVGEEPNRDKIMAEMDSLRVLPENKLLEKIP